MLGYKNKIVTKQRQEIKSTEINQPKKKPKPPQKQKSKAQTPQPGSLTVSSKSSEKTAGQSLEKGTQLCNLFVSILLLDTWSSVKKAERCAE